jgi:hypothetical protein
VSGKDRTNFAKQNGWPLSTFRIWIKRLDKGDDNAVNKGPGIFPVHVVNVASPSTTSPIIPSSLEPLIFKSPAGWHLEIPAHVSTAWLTELLKSLS